MRVSITDHRCIDLDALTIGRLVTHSAILVVTLTVGAAGQEAATPRLRLELDEKTAAGIMAELGHGEGHSRRHQSIARRQRIGPACAHQ